MEILNKLFLSGMIIGLLSVTTEILLEQFHIIGSGLIAAIALSVFLKKDLENLDKFRA